MKKYLLAFAVLAMSMAVFTACGSDDDEELLLPVITANFSEADLTVKEGETLVIEPKYANVDEKTTYEWTCRDAIISKEPKLTYIFYEYGTYAVRLKVTTKAGTSQQDFRITVNENLVTVDFEGEYWSKWIPSGQAFGCNLIYGEEALSYHWNDSIIGLSGGLTLAWGGQNGFAEGGAVISNYIDANLKEHATADYQLSVPASNGSKNFVVVYCGSPVTISFPKDTKHVIKSIDFGPTTYELGVVKYGNEYAKSLAEEGHLYVDIKADNDPERVIRLNLAKNGKLLDEWSTCRLQGFEAVNSLTFTMGGTDSSEWNGATYLSTPAYFAIDNIVVKP